MSWSLRRALAVRFAATMAVGLAAASAAVLLGVTEAVRRPADTGLGVVIVALAGIILVGTSADPYMLRLLPPLILSTDHVQRLSSALEELTDAPL